MLFKLFGKLAIRSWEHVLLLCLARRFLLGFLLFLLDGWFRFHYPHHGFQLLHQLSINWALIGFLLLRVLRILPYLHLLRLVKSRPAHTISQFPQLLLPNFLNILSNGIRVFQVIHSHVEIIKILKCVIPTNVGVKLMGNGLVKIFT